MNKYIFTILPMMTVFFGTAQAALVSTGPDNFGYFGNTIVNNVRDISTSGSFLDLSDDETSSAINIGFIFDFYGLNYTDTFVSSNGFMGFSSGMDDGCCSGEIIPSTNNPNNLIAGLWEDLNKPQGNIRTQTVGAAGSREFIVGFYDVAHFSSGPLVTFEMILHETTNYIEFQYGSIISDGGIYTVGIENLNGTDGLQVLNSSVLDFSNTGYLITPVPEPSTYALMLGGLGLVGFMAMRRREQQTTE